MRALALPFALLLTACPGAPGGPDDDDATEPPAFDAELGQALQAALDAQLATVPAPALSMAVVAPDGAVWTGASGVRGPGLGDAEVDDRYAIASISKTVTGGLVLTQLDDDLLSLDDSLEDHLPGAHPRGGDITVRMLLQHTAGLPEVTGTPAFQAEIERAWTLTEQMELLRDEPLTHEPGADWDYSNAHYIALGLVAEAAGGAPYRELMQDHLFDPLGLDSMEVPEDDGWGDVVRSYVGTTPVTLFVHPVATGPAGGVVADARDTARWIHARATGELLSDASTTLQTEDAHDLPGGASSGLGLFVLPSAGGPDVGHDGALNGFASWASHRPETGYSLAILGNAWGAGTPPDSSWPVAIREALWAPILDAESR